MAPNVKNKLHIFLFIILIIISVWLRSLIFKNAGGDHLVYRQAVSDFANKINPYLYTITSFNVYGLDHGYAYFPTLLYILYFFQRITTILNLDIPTTIIWKIPVLFADLVVAILLYKHFWNKNRFIGLLATAFWLLNPYFISRYEYTLYDPIQVMFIFLALWFFEKHKDLSALLLGAAISIKIIPIILVPILLIDKNINKFRYLIWIAVYFIFISLPFMFKVEDIIFYLQGTLLLHGERGIQGRPFISIIQYALQGYGLNLYQWKYASLFTVLSLTTGPLVTTYLYLKKEINNKYVLGTICFLLYYLFTPIFNRTHILWILPFLLIAIYETLKTRNKFILYTTYALVYASMFIYLSVWTKGLKQPLQGSDKVWMDKANSKPYEYPILTTLKNTYYDYRHKLLN